LTNYGPPCLENGFCPPSYRDLAADVVGYSRLMGADEEGTRERLKARLGQLVDPKIKEHGGRTVKNPDCKEYWGRDARGVP
jgi:hypothetical protein